MVLCVSQQHQQQPASTKTEQVKEVESEFGQNVRTHREEWEWSQREFATRLTAFGMSVDASAVSRLEKGTRAVRLGEASIIADVLQVELDELLSGDDSPRRVFSAERNFANRSMNEARSALSDMIQSFLQVADLVDKHPDLAKRLIDDDFPAPTNGDEYLDWVMKRTQRLNEKWWDHVEEMDEARAAKAQQLVHTVAGEMVGPNIPTPRWKLEEQRKRDAASEEADGS
jgi:transcriptional regulator with XRE-family HTH domain